jgi:hypothetical protein
MLLSDEVGYNNVSRHIILVKQSLRSTSWSCLFLPTIRYSSSSDVSHPGASVDTPAEAKCWLECWSQPAPIQETRLIRYRCSLVDTLSM